MFRGRVKKIHFVGIGGIGMSGIAEVLAAMGCQVSGSDLAGNDTTRRLQSLGVKVFLGHEAANIDDSDVVVTSSAVKADNPEVTEAAGRNIPVIPRAEMLAELCRMKYSVLVAGAHGKTTTTSLAATVMANAGMDPTMVIGGRLSSLGTNARLGAGEYLVAEADESDGSFLKLLPVIAVVTNIDREHMDHYRTFDAVLDAFTAFLNKVPFYGRCIVCLDCPHIRSILPSVTRGVTTYGFGENARYRAVDPVMKNASIGFTALRDGEPIGEFEVALTGRHNVLNTLAAVAVADEIGISMPVAAAALGTFKGIHRRFELKGIEAGIRVVDDYGHHPTEIKATLAGAREAFTGRIVVAFQPHRYTRTKDLMDEFAGAFGDADVLLLTDIYAASERPMEGVTGEALAARIIAAGHRNARYAGPRAGIAGELKKIAREGDLVITLGAGDLWKSGMELLEMLRRRGGKNG